MTEENIPLSKHRIEALADGVFAIVATLIVLELHVPDMPRNSTNMQILEGLRHIGFPLFSFVLTFVLAGSYWSLHQLMLHFVKRVNGAFLWLNIFFLMFVSLLPFSTGLFGRFRPTSGLPLAVYFGNQAIIGALLWLLWQFARWKDLLAPEAGMARARNLPTRAGSLALGSGLAAGLAYFAPTMAFIGMLIPALIARKIIWSRTRSAGVSGSAIESTPLQGPTNERRE